MEGHEKEFYSVADLQKKFCCGKSKAEAIMRCIKAYVAEPMPLRGKVLVTEYEAWKNRPMAKLREVQNDLL